MVESTTGWSELEVQAIREQLKRTLGSQLFVHAKRLCRFLEFVVDETLEGRPDRLNQFAIAIDVFDRDETFDPAVDAIVRVEAGRLRSKLLEYYDDPGRSDPVRILLPKRSYAADFQFQHESGIEIVADAGGGNAEGQPAYGVARVTDLINPVIAVLPFANMSGDSDQEYFADGITEDLITDLSKLSGLAVIARHSTFSYKGKAVTVQKVCSELGANTVLEGSIRKLGNRVRITAQLIEGSTGQHLWAQRYDRNLGDIFELQDEVNQKIVSALAVRLSATESARFGRRGTDVIDAYDYVLRGMKEAQDHSLEGSVRARYCFESALELDPGYATAYARLALNYIYRWIYGGSANREDSVDVGFELASKAVALDDQLALAHAALCWAHLWQGEHDKAISEGQLAITLDPGDVLAHARLALSMIFSGDAESSLPLIDRAHRLNPGDSYDFIRGVAMFMLHRYEEAIKHLRVEFDQSPNFIPAALFLAASQTLNRQEFEAAATVKDILQINPNYTLSSNFRSHYKNPGDRERFVNALRQSGLP
jgi:adenylate cyclase